MKFKKKHYKITKDKVEVTESEEEIDTEQTRRMEAMAQAKPGEIVVGINCNKPEVEQEHYLSDL